MQIAMREAAAEPSAGYTRAVTRPGLQDRYTQGFSGSARSNGDASDRGGAQQDTQRFRLIKPVTWAHLTSGMEHSPGRRVLGWRVNDFLSSSGRRRPLSVTKNARLQLGSGTASKPPWAPEDSHPRSWLATRSRRW